MFLEKLTNLKKGEKAMFRLNDVTENAVELLEDLGVVKEAYSTKTNGDIYDVFLDDDIEVLVNDMTLKVFNASGDAAEIKCTDYSYFVKG